MNRTAMPQSIHEYLTWIEPDLSDERLVKVEAIVCEALAEDAREGSQFDLEGFGNFCPEEDPDDVGLAWAAYHFKHFKW